MQYGKDSAQRVNGNRKTSTVLGAQEGALKQGLAPPKVRDSGDLRGAD